MNQEQFDALMRYIDARVKELIEGHDPLMIGWKAAELKDHLFETLQ